MSSRIRVELAATTNYDIYRYLPTRAHLRQDRRPHTFLYCYYNKKLSAAAAARSPAKSLEDSLVDWSGAASMDEMELLLSIASTAKVFWINESDAAASDPAAEGVLAAAAFTPVQPHAATWAHCATAVRILKRGQSAAGRWARGGEGKNILLNSIQ